MRKIETLMNKAIENGTNWSLDNTTVQTVDEVAHVYLHGNLISKIGEGFIELFDGGKQSRITNTILLWYANELIKYQQLSAFVIT
jgi:hypothetical protein